MWSTLRACLPSINQRMYVGVHSTVYSCHSVSSLKPSIYYWWWLAFFPIMLVLKAWSVILGTSSTSISFHPECLSDTGPSQKVKNEVTVPSLFYDFMRALNLPYKKVSDVLTCPLLYGVASAPLRITMASAVFLNIFLWNQLVNKYQVSFYLIYKSG